MTRPPPLPGGGVRPRAINIWRVDDADGVPRRVWNPRRRFGRVPADWTGSAAELRTIGLTINPRRGPPAFALAAGIVLTVAILGFLGYLATSGGAVGRAGAVLIVVMFTTVHFLRQAIGVPVFRDTPASVIANGLLACGRCASCAYPLGSGRDHGLARCVECGACWRPPRGS